MLSEENLSMNEIQPTELRFSLNFFAFDNFPKFFGRISKVLGRTLLRLHRLVTKAPPHPTPLSS
jgi:hypothetical protein